MSRAIANDGLLPGMEDGRWSSNNQDVDHKDAIPLHDELVLDDPAESPPPLYSIKEPPKSAGSIYDFLDQVELKSAHQLESTSSNMNSASPSHLPPLVRTDMWEGSRLSPRSERGAVASMPSKSSAIRHISGPSSSSTTSRSDNQLYADIREKVVTLNIELHDKTETIELLHAARKKDKARAKEKANQAAAEFQAKLEELQGRHEKELEKQLDFAQTLVADKGELVQKCDQLAAELKKAVDRAHLQEEGFQRQLKDAKERWSVQEKVRRDQWMAKKTDEIKKSTIKALEPDVQAIMTKCKENLDKAKEAAADEKRKLVLAHEKEKDEVLRRQREEYERKLVEAREKERSKLMYRLDAADAELQQQLNQQRRRLQDEAEKLRTDLMHDMRTLKQQHARDLDEMRAIERQRVEQELAALQKDKDDMARRFDLDAVAFREKVQSEMETKQQAAVAAVRAEIEKDRAKWEADMIKRRDDKIGMVIDKLQQETEKKVAAAEAKLAAQYDADMREMDKKRRAAAEVEAAWMEKNRELYDKCAKLEDAREAAIAAHSQQAEALRACEERLARCVQTLQEEREMHDKARFDGSKYTETLRREYDMERDALRGAVESLQAKLETMEKNHTAYVAEMRGNHDDVIEKLHARVRSTVAKKDDMIETLREELHLAQVRVAKCEAIINEQRAQLIA
ncbi:hypothetical protein H310_02157 [Aphanomyces invadans]|uniref:Uncharacterized protein n=1 Tax=Aphanomyces invadans TaxID=157072 RepID=A0A024UPY7_9STRA|nr:hypothetical protein H310_02157 [Aphanomyces invadans]ETW07708.1 hypothetical protein H310_02157 [Aphanomyces invadans]|eukprot:XP_008863801.1 hypothetical protein H310_02157 [Aphanomyces invadans]